MTDSSTIQSEKTNPQSNRPKTWLNIVLFFATQLTVFLAGSHILDIALFHHYKAPVESAQWIGAILEGLLYTAGLMGILVSHEMGHYILARRHNVPASLPYFIPLPPPFLLGTGGAVILMKGRIRSRNALMEIGAAGPLAGMLIAVPLTAVGLSFSQVIEIPEQGLFIGESLLFAALRIATIGPIPDGYDVVLHPLAWAGWVGMLVTMINLLPISQLDGGHIFYALFGKSHDKISKLFHKLLFALGAGVIVYGLLGLDWEALRAEGGLTSSSSIETISSAAMPGFTWFFLGGFLHILLRKRGFGHPPTDDDNLSTGNRTIGYLCLAIFVLTFMPIVIKPFS